MSEDKTPHEHAKANGLVRKGTQLLGGSQYELEHAVADQVHGWSLNDYHEQGTPPEERFRISEDDYEQAVASAMKSGTPHKAALPESQKNRGETKQQTHVHGQPIKLEQEGKAQ